MSAICGIISLDGKPIRNEARDSFRASYEACKIDQYRDIQTDNALLGCALQYFTKEAKDEVLPIRDEEHHLLFTADCLLDNREELIRGLQISDPVIPDGSLIYQAYLAWGKDCVKRLRGVFSFVVYDWEKQEVTLFADQFCTRCLFYHVRDNVLYFSTLLMPMIKASGLTYTLNQTWLVDSISVLTPAMMFETRECAYQDVYKVDCGQMLHVRKDTAPVYECYYDPVKAIPTDYHMTDARCKQELYDTLFHSIKNCLRTSGEVGIQLSSGLDSSTIGCIAAPYLDEQGKKLYSYTSVPLDDSPKGQDHYHVDDETAGVMKIVEAHPNIIPSFLKCEGKNILTDGEKIVDFWELPCQSHQNAVWIADIFETAASEGCRIMLTGATGNCTVSAGSFTDALMHQVLHGHPIKGLQEFRTFCRGHRLPTKRILKGLMREYMDYLKTKWHLTPYGYKEAILTREDLLTAHHFEARVAKTQLLNKPWTSMKRYRDCIYLRNAYAQIGEINTKHSLQFGVLERDPLRNVEFINFCMKLPMHFFVNENYDRRLVREFMQGVVPVEICTDFYHRGRQSGDNSYRISKSWDTYHSLIDKRLLSQTGLTYFDEARIHEKLDPLTAENLMEHEFDLRNCIDGAMFVYYVEQLQKYT